MKSSQRLVLTAARSWRSGIIAVRNRAARNQAATRRRTGFKGMTL